MTIFKWVIFLDCRHESGIPGLIPTYEITAPENLKGEYLDSLSFKVNWTEEYREYFQREKRYGKQIGVCAGRNFTSFGDIQYPENMKEYVPPNKCFEESDPSSANILVVFKANLLFWLFAMVNFL